MSVEKLFGGNKSILGTVDSDLILQTLGRIYIKSGKSTKLLDDVIKSLVNIQDIEQQFVIQANDKYPGDNKLLYNSQKQVLSITSNGKIIPLISTKQSGLDYVKRSGDNMSGTLTLEAAEPLVINSTRLIKNLNSEYLDGYKSSDYPKKSEDALIDGSWHYNKDITFEKSLQSPIFNDGFNGYGWKLDSKTNTLTIDNLIVRHTLNVFKLVANKITATNGSFWVANSAKVLSKTYTSPQSGQYFYKGQQYTGNYYEYNEYQFPIISKDNGQYNWDILNTTIYQCKDNYVTSGQYDTLNIFETYFLNGPFIITVNEGVFDVGDLLLCQKQVGQNIISYNLLIISVILQDSDSTSYLVVINNLSEIDKDDVLVQYGNIINKSRQGSVYLTSTESQSPYILVISDVNTPDYNYPFKTPIFNPDNTPKQSDGKYLYEEINHIKARLGNINGQYDKNFLDAYNQSTIKGFGLYCNNAYLTGEFFLNNGKSVVDFTKEGILLQFENAGLQIKNLGNNKHGVVLSGDQIQILTKDNSGNDVYTALFSNGYISANLIKSLELESSAQVNGIPVWKLNQDGSGYLAGKNIEWDTTGNIKFTGEINTQAGQIADFKITNRSLESKINNQGLELTNKGIAFTAEYSNNTWHKHVWMGTQYYNNDYSIYINNNRKQRGDKTGIYINTSNADRRNTAIQIDSGNILGLRLGPKFIQRDITLDKLFNYIKCIDNGTTNGNFTITLPKLYEGDLGLSYIIHNGCTNPITLNNSDYTIYVNHNNTDNVEQKIIPTRFHGNNAINYNLAENSSIIVTFIGNPDDTGLETVYYWDVITL